MPACLPKQPYRETATADGRVYLHDMLDIFTVWPDAIKIQ
jgi:hypothetical protein